MDCYSEAPEKTSVQIKMSIVSRLIGEQDDWVGYWKKKNKVSKTNNCDKSTRELWWSNTG